jgi:hypothetical protein
VIRVAWRTAFGAVADDTILGRDPHVVLVAGNERGLRVPHREPGDECSEHEERNKKNDLSATHPASSSEVPVRPNLESERRRIIAFGTG